MNYKQRVADRRAELRALQLQRKNVAAALKEAQVTAVASARASEVVQEVAEQVQRKAYGAISSIVTRCLRQVWGDEAYEARIDVRKKRGKTEAHIVFARGDVVIDTPQDSCGGGVVDVAAFALRLAAIRLSRPRRRQLLVLDEPMRFVSADRRQAVAEMIKALANEMDMQIIMVTHIDDFKIGSVIDTKEI